MQQRFTLICFRSRSADNRTISQITTSDGDVGPSMLRCDLWRAPFLRIYTNGARRYFSSSSPFIFVLGRPHFPPSNTKNNNSIALFLSPHPLYFLLLTFFPLLSPLPNILFFIRYTCAANCVLFRQVEHKNTKQITIQMMSVPNSHILGPLFWMSPHNAFPFRIFIFRT